MKSFYLFLAFILFVFTANSQLNYTSSNYASGNYTLPMTTVASGILVYDFDTTGANITWDYTGLGMDLSGSRSTSTASGSGYQAPYITQCILAGGGFTCLSKWNQLTNIGIIDLDSIDAVVFTLYDVMTMAKKNSGELIGNVKGLKIKDTNGLTVPIVAEYAESDTILTFPFTYQDSGKSYGEWGVDLNSIGQNIVYKITYDRTWEVEGWGTLKTPYKTHSNVLKVKTTLDQVDSVNFFGSPFGIPRKLIEYTWYDATYGLPVMKADGIEVLGTVAITSVQYYDTRTVGLDESEEKYSVSVFPNPTTENLNVFTSNKEIVRYKVINTQGQTIQTGKISNSIFVNTFKPGMYIIQFLNKENLVLNTERFIKE